MMILSFSTLQNNTALKPTGGSFDGLDGFSTLQNNTALKLKTFKN